jgi:hypothetical protein
VNVLVLEIYPTIRLRERVLLRYERVRFFKACRFLRAIMGGALGDRALPCAHGKINVLYFMQSVNPSFAGWRNKNY